mmetsp:Transcript_71271/g.123775  ORF Transcript_71271/g.123775 Transcript_71271/m.123775 type:complete len:297 (+) Transcript_71271:601-1491(+)
MMTTATRMITMTVRMMMMMSTMTLLATRRIRMRTMMKPMFKTVTVRITTPMGQMMRPPPQRPEAVVAMLAKMVALLPRIAAGMVTMMTALLRGDRDGLMVVMVANTVMKMTTMLPAHGIVTMMMIAIARTVMMKMMIKGRVPWTTTTTARTVMTTARSHPVRGRSHPGRGMATAIAMTAMPTTTMPTGALLMSQGHARVTATMKMVMQLAKVTMTQLMMTREGGLRRASVIQVPSAMTMTTVHKQRTTRGKGKATMMMTTFLTMLIAAAKMLLMMQLLTVMILRQRKLHLQSGLIA